MPATIRDVAKIAGVGLGTVSRVLNESPLVSDATRQRVLEVIAELDFSPSPIARRLSLGRTLSIAAIVPFFTRPAFVERLRGVESMLTESEYDLIIYNVETPERRDICFREVPRSERVDGVLVFSLGPGELNLERLAAADVPIVFIDVNHPEVEGFHRVVTDDVAGGRQAARHLLDLGHRRLGFVGDSPHNGFGFRSSTDRFRGFCQELEKAGVSCMPEYDLYGQHGRFEARRLARQLLAMSQPPTAIFAASDTQAMGVLEAAREAGLRIPQDLSVIGYDDIEIAEFLELTTVRQLLFESGERGVRLLLRVLTEQLTAPSCEVLPTELVERSTTAPPAGAGHVDKW